ncbi:MAG TPA: N-acetyltransferase [Candidatus Enterocola sp.]|nr:N-acetyltransferase [Candidatus Enterocola sp.]
MDISIREVLSKKELKAFVQFGIDLYDGNDYFCPPLISDELDTLDRHKNPAFEVCESIYFLAYRDNKIVGRIAGIINHRANDVWNVKKTRFGWFDFIDDTAVSKALLDAVAAWGKSKGMDTLNGPVGFTDMDHQGLLLEGYEYLSPMAALYNYPYYVKHFDEYGFEKEADWIEIRCKNSITIPERMVRVGNIITEKYNVKIEKVRNSKEIVKRFGYNFFDVVDEAYKPLYNYSPLTQRQKEYYSKMYFPLLNYDFVTLVTNELDELVGVGVVMPNISKALRKAKGKLFPFGWYYLLKALKSKKVETVDLLLIAVRPDYQNKGVNSLLFIDQIPYYNKYGVVNADVTAVLETNYKNQANFSFFDHEIHKRRRAYIKTI